VVADQHVDEAGLFERARHGVGVLAVGPARWPRGRCRQGRGGWPRAPLRSGRGRGLGHGEPHAAGPARGEDVVAFQ
jgi:hypothetical protein